MDYGLQLFSVRDFTANDLEGTLAKVAEMGYKTVEFAGYFGHSGADIRRMLDENGLKAIGTHSGADGLRPENIQPYTVEMPGMPVAYFVAKGPEDNTLNSFGRTFIIYATLKIRPHHKFKFISRHLHIYAYIA